MKFERLVIASHNKGKIEEISKILAPLNIKVISVVE